MDYQSTADYLSMALAIRNRPKPQIMIICGSGLSGLSSHLENPLVIDYEKIPGFPVATVQGHFGELVFGSMGGIECVCMKGRFHFYEGNSMETVVFPVRVCRLLGAKLLLVTNAAGGLNPDYNIGDIMVIQDHFGLPCVAGNTPSRGLNDDFLGPRFYPVSDTYDSALQDIVLSSASKLGYGKVVRPNGTYCFVSGPQYESKAECRFLRSVGGDSVGMSTVPEVLAARHCGMKILGLSLITNKVVMGFPGQSSDSTVIHASHKEVLESAKASGLRVEQIVKDVINPENLKEYLDSLPDFVYEGNGTSSIGSRSSHGGPKSLHWTLLLAITTTVAGIYFLRSRRE